MSVNDKLVINFSTNTLNQFESHELNLNANNNTNVNKQNFIANIYKTPHLKSSS